MMKRRSVCLCLALLLLLPMLLTGCSKGLEKITATFDDNFGYLRAGTGLIAQNDLFELWWDDVAQCALLYDMSMDRWYGTTPYDYYVSMPNNRYADNLLYSPINISYVKTDSNTHMSNIDYAYSKSNSIDYLMYDPLLDENGQQIVDANNVPQYSTDPQYIDHPDGMTVPRSGVSSELIENGVRVNYAFPDLRISVTLELILNEKGLEARIPLDRIQEEDNLIYEISILPYFASAANGDDAYLMVPSGGGALIDARNTLEKKSYEESVYGEDKSDFNTMIKHTSNQIHLPVFGSHDANGGMLGVIDQGSACGRVLAEVGDSKLEYENLDGASVNYSHVYASFRVRGHEEILYNSMGNQSLAAPKYSQSIADYEYLSVQYYPLQDDTSYVGMANAYRQHLQDRGFLQTRPESVPALSVSFLGATQTPQSFFGVPYSADTATTTVERTQEITAELNELVNNSGLLVNLRGYGKGGLSNTKVGGQFKPSGKVGSKKDWENLTRYAADNNVILSMDYEAIYFQNGSSGFGVGNSTSYSISQLDVEIGTYVLNTAVQDENGEYWYLLTRGKVAAAVDKAIAANKDRNIGAISFTSLSKEAYSDYRDHHNTAKAHMEEDVLALLNRCTENGLKVVATQANDYAALAADYVIETPMQSSKYSILSQEIPFYSLVFQGYKSLTSPAINTTINVRETYLRAVATGMTLQFTLCDTHHDSLQFEQNTAYITSRYSDWKGDIAQMVQESAELHNKVGNQAILQYTIENGLSTTVFEDGTTVCVNYTDKEMDSSLGTVPAMGFVYG